MTGSSLRITVAAAALVALTGCTETTAGHGTVDAAAALPTPTPTPSPQAIAGCPGSTAHLRIGTLAGKDILATNPDGLPIDAHGTGEVTPTLIEQTYSVEEQEGGKMVFLLNRSHWQQPAYGRMWASGVPNKPGYRREFSHVFQFDNVTDSCQFVADMGKLRDRLGLIQPAGPVEPGQSLWMKHYDNGTLGETFTSKGNVVIVEDAFLADQQHVRNALDTQLRGQYGML